ncbi:MAG: hypothetical protein K6357_00715 [Elusimicrobiota bacterium]
MNFIKKMLFFNTFFVFLLPSFSQEQQKYYKFPPIKYVSLIKDLNDYYLYANGGFHADWYIGYNNAWIVKLPPMDIKNYSRAYVGVKMGRTKNKTYPTSDDTDVYESKILISVSQSSVFPSFSYVIAENSEIPLEPLAGDSLKKVDSAKWFWVNVPLNRFSSEKDNYISVWAQSQDLSDSSKSPIIAAGYLEDGVENVWVNHSIKGAMPVNDSALEMAISGLKPAIVVKLIAENDFKVVIKNFSYEFLDDRYIYNWNVIGTDVYKSWIEISYDRLEWKKYGDYVYSPPYFISFSSADMPKDIFYLRACATDIYENVGCSNHINMNLIKQEKKEDL